MRYRRSNDAGATYFFTVNLQNRSSQLLLTHIDLLRTEIKRVRHAHPFVIEAMVIVPDHLHAIWTLPERDNQFASRWALIKSGFSRAMPRKENISGSRVSKRERGIWQRRYWEHLIRDDNDWNRHIDYIHFNPVKHGYVSSAIEWPYSSIHRFVREGVLPVDWAGVVSEKTIDAGERV